MESLLGLKLFWVFLLLLFVILLFVVGIVKIREWEFVEDIDFVCEILLMIL